MYVTRVGKSMQMTISRMFVAVALTMTVYLHMTEFAKQNTGHVKEWFAGMDQGIWRTEPDAWRPRIFAFQTVSAFFEKKTDTTVGDYVRTVALVYALCYGLSFAMILAYSPWTTQRMTACALVLCGWLYSFTITSRFICLPWDPIVVPLWTAIFFASMSGNCLLLLALVGWGTGFKETTALGCIAFLSHPSYSRGWKMVWFVCALGLCALVKMGLDYQAGVLFSPSLQYGNAPRFLHNLRVLLCFSSPQPGYGASMLNHPLFINAGLVIPLLFHRAHSSMRAFWTPWKAIAWFLVIGNFFCGRLDEARELLEILPVSAMYVCMCLDRD